MDEIGQPIKRLRIGTGKTEIKNQIGDYLMLRGRIRNDEIGRDRQRSLRDNQHHIRQYKSVELECAEE